MQQKQYGNGDKCQVKNIISVTLHQNVNDEYFDVYVLQHLRHMNSIVLVVVCIYTYTCEVRELYSPLFDCNRYSSRLLCVTGSLNLQMIFGLIRNNFFAIDSFRDQYIELIFLTKKENKGSVDHLNPECLGARQRCTPAKRKPARF